MQTSIQLFKLTQVTKRAVCRTTLALSLPLLFLVLTIGLFSQAMMVSRAEFAAPNDSLTPNSLVAQSLACGALVSDTIGAAAEVDQFTFSGQANERKTLTLTSGPFTATAKVISPAGVTVVTFNANSQQQLLLQESGTYVIQVQASNLVSTGTYHIGLECLLPTSPVDANLVCGTLLSSRAINAASQIDQITFGGQANERKTLTLTSGPLTVTAKVFSPTGIVVAMFNANGLQQLLLPESGTYVIQVQASNLVSTGTYHIGLECLLPTSPVDANLSCGTLLSNREITAASQVDQITFTGQANERKTLTLTSGSFTATATVFSPTGTVVIIFNANSQQQLILPETGTYVIQIRASNLVSTGTYHIGLECLLPSPMEPNLACGTLLSNREIIAAAQVDQITFIGQANERKTLTLTSGSFTATATVFSPTGTVVIIFNANSQQQLILPETGTYVIQIRASNLVSTGTYHIGLECLLPTSPVDKILICGAPPLQGTISAASQVDQISFCGLAGQQVTLTLTSGGFTATATVFSPTGDRVTTFNANSQSQLTLPERGTYVIQVRASNLVSTGTYSLGLQCLLPTITLSPNPLKITSGTSGSLTVTIGIAQSTAITVNLSSSNPAVATVPASVTITANTTSNTFSVTGITAGSATITATLSACSEGGRVMVDVMVEPPFCKPNSQLPNNFLPFSEIYYITGPNAAGDRLVVGKVLTPPFTGVPMPDPTNQQFCNPVRLSNGFVALAYVPTSSERNGDFSPFAGLLRDPDNGQPFPGGIIPANRLGKLHAWRIVSQVGGPVLVNAASYSVGELASESIAAVFGSELATETRIADSLPLPTTLGGSTLAVRDSMGLERPANFFFVSPGQINFLVPSGMMNGWATAIITSGNGSVSIGTAQILTVAPGLFAANANGMGVAAGVALRVKADGSQTFERISREEAQNRFVPVPIDLGTESDQIFLLLYGTGFRFRSNLTAANVTIGGANSEVTYAGLAPGFEGLDQANVRIPRSLIGRGDVNVVMTVDGKVANVVLINIK